MPAHNLPAQPTSLVGRESEIEALRARLVDEDVRLLTFTGPAGTGKTRLALAVAAASAEAYSHGAWLVDLTPVTDEAGVRPEVVRALGVRSAGDAPADEALRLYLREKHLLLVLDNFEHVLGAAPGVAALLDSCPKLHIVTTSREPLRVRWERLYPVLPLRLPTPSSAVTLAELAEAPAVELFVQRARDVQPAFALNERSALAVAELCRRLDGLPLAIELAAARCRALPPEAILARLEHRLDLLVGGRRDEPARHQTVRAALAWSHELLKPAEQTLFRRLGAFVGGCTPEAAEAVCNATGDLGADVLDGLESLLAKSLLKQDEPSGEPRFGMLETVHAYAIESLQQSGELAEIRAAHIGYFLKLAQTAEVELRGPDQMRWLARLDRELANLRAALAGLVWQAAAGDADAHERALLLVGAMWWYWHVRGEYAEARQIVAPLLAAAPADRVSPGRAHALSTAGIAAWGLGDFATARVEVEESLAVHRVLGDHSATSQALIKVTCVAMSQGEMARADAAVDEALALARNIDDGWNAGWAMTFSGILAVARGDLDSATAWFEESLAIRRRLGDTFGIAWSVNGLASVARLRGDAATARPLYEECLATFRALGERPNVASILDGLGEVAIAQGDFVAAAERFRESLDLYREVGSTRGIGIALSGFAALAAAEWRAERAVRLAGAATALHEAGGGAIELIKPRGSDAWLDEARRALGDEAEQVWASGRALSPDEAVAYALAADPTSHSVVGVRRAGRGTAGRGDLLTAREHEVAELVARGSSNRQIAEELVISERTAETHVSNILAKLGLATRVQLATWIADARRTDGTPV